MRWEGVGGVWLEHGHDWCRWGKGLRGKAAGACVTSKQLGSNGSCEGRGVDGGSISVGFGEMKVGVWAADGEVRY